MKSTQVIDASPIFRMIEVVEWEERGRVIATYMAPIFLCIRLRSPRSTGWRPIWEGNWKQVSQEDPTHSSASA